MSEADSRPRVLVVDDDPDLREIMADVLGDAGMEVTTAADGAAALARLGERRVDLILLDLHMAGMDGREFRTRQLADPELADIPVILLTAGGEQAPPGLDALGYLRKPVELEELVGAVQGAVRPPSRQ